MSDVAKNWEKFLSANTLKGNLISISIFITVFELFKKRVIDMPVVFFSDWKGREWVISQEEYKKDVLSRSKSPICASLLWLKELDAIDQNDINKFEEIKNHRNELTHDLFAFISDSGKNLDSEKLSDLINLLLKIEKWWFINFECEVDPFICKEDLNIDEVITPSQWQLKLLFDIALGNEPEENFYFNRFIKNKLS